MFPILLLAFIFVPIIEIALFVQVGGVLGLWPTIGLVLLTALVGASLVRSQGIQTVLSVQSRLEKGELPAQQILEGVMLAVCGVLLLTPGFMTDAMGMIVLLPAPRAALAQYLMTKVVVKQSGHFHSSGFGGGFGQGPFDPQDPSAHNPFEQNRDEQGNTFEGEFERKDDENDKNNRLH
ncbi:FxsA family protein [Vibrio sp. WXL210]|uniref:FxsA family protein n=1 Tax=Vibrio sp. WXL210 TaxID=3450709 RepID=UPI003EC5C7B6